MKRWYTFCICDSSVSDTHPRNPSRWSAIRGKDSFYIFFNVSDYNQMLQSSEKHRLRVSHEGKDYQVLYESMKEVTDPKIIQALGF